ncbi:MAG: zinc ribbon domain-containing protein [Desulfobacterales bacterium]
MPIHEFSCTQCGRVFEYLILSPKDPDPCCPDCGNTELKRLMSAGNVRAHGIPSGSGGFTPPKCTPAGGT